MKIVVVGAGYVGLVAGTCFAETGHDVQVVEVDQKKIDSLSQGKVPFYEPGIADLLRRNLEQQRLQFTQDIRKALRRAQVVFIAVGTPQGEDGSADLSFVLQVAQQIGQAMEGPLVVVNKSTVPVGTADRVGKVIEAISSHPVTVVSNPEFLKEGAALGDFMKPDRVIIGTEDEDARKLMADLYAPFLRTGNPILFMDNRSAELSKYAANGLLATRISFMNEIALLCDAVGADVDHVRFGMGSDARIGHAFLFPGVGYGGSCFPKDVRALKRTGAENGLEMEILKAADRVNERQKNVITRRIASRFGTELAGLTFAIWGLAFKPRTDDVREAPALVIIENLLRAGAQVKVYDPEAMENVREILGDRISYCADGYECCQEADALVVVTEWNEFRWPDFERMHKLLKQPVLFDGRNLYDPKRMKELGFEHIGMGRSLAT